MFALANADDICEIAKIYDDCAGYLEKNINYAHWKKGVYPVREVAEDGFSRNELYVFKPEGKIIGTVILNSSQPEQYKNVTFSNGFKDDEILVIHTLVISPKHFGNGVGFHIMQHIDNHALLNGYKTIRMDTYYKNIPATNLYLKAGYKFVGMVDLELGFEGMFKCFEKNIGVYENEYR